MATKQEMLELNISILKGMRVKIKVLEEMMLATTWINEHEKLSIGKLRNIIKDQL